MISDERILELWQSVNNKGFAEGLNVPVQVLFARALLKEVGMEELQREAALRNVELQREYERYVAECPKYGVTPYTFEVYKNRVDAREEQEK